MFTHAVLGANDIKKAKQFYDATLGALGYKYIGPMGENAAMYGKDGPEFIVTKPSRARALSVS
jgi:catechol 2,3-dioxygenase-like lactoylglutathione lyase family enzyme